MALSKGSLAAGLAWPVLLLNPMTHRRIVGLFLGLCLGTGCSSSGGDDGGGETESATTATNNGQTANNNAVTQTASTSASGTATTSSGASTTTASGTATAAGNGSGGAGTDGTTTSAGDTTDVGGAAGNANATSEVTTTGAGGDEACPSELPPADSACPSVNQNCYYEDCSGAGRSLASCADDGWAVSTAPCADTVYCSAGGAECSEGEICLIRAGGAFLQECVPNTCETGPVECDCIEGCSGECATYGDAETGITITCNTCPSGMACP
jgi:hypothetical protein